MSKKVLLATAVTAVGFLAGCGSSHKQPATAPRSSTPTTQAALPASPPTTSPNAAEQATVVAWAKADTAQATCSLMSYGFKLGIAFALHASPANCIRNATKALGPFRSTSVHILSALQLNGQTRITAIFGDGRRTDALWLVRQCGAYKVNSINGFHPNPPAPRC
jgi:hypothetical protein